MNTFFALAIFLVETASSAVLDTRQAATCASNAFTTTGPGTSCFSFLCCYPANATYDDLPTCTDLQTYGNLSYVDFDVEAPNAAGCAILPSSGNHLARGSAAKAAASGTLPTLNSTESFHIYSFDFACAIPGTVDAGTQEAVDCTLNATAQVPPAESSLGDPSSNIFNYTAPTDTDRATLQHVETAFTFTGFAFMTLDAKDKDGNAVDVYIDNVQYQSYHYGTCS